MPSGAYPRGRTGKPTKSPSMNIPGTGGVVSPRGATKTANNAAEIGAKSFGAVKAPVSVTDK